MQHLEPDTHTSADSAATSSRLDQQILAVCDAVGDFIAYWGFKSVLGRIWALLALSTDPISQIEVSRRLGISRSLVSESIAELLERGLVRPTYEGRNAPYVAVLNVWPTISDVLRSREWMLIEQARVRLEAAVEEAQYGAGNPKERYDMDRLRLLLAMTELAQGFLRILIAVRRPQALRQLGEWIRKAAALLRDIGKTSLKN